MRPPARWLMLCALLALAVVRSASSSSSSQNDNNTAGAAQTWGAAGVAGGGGSGRQRELLKWALSESDPAALRQQAEAAKKHSSKSALEAPSLQRGRVQELLEAVRQQPTEAELIQQAAAQLANSSATQQQKLSALEALQYLVEDIDHANNLQSLSALEPVVALLLPPGAGGSGAPSPEERAALAAGAARVVHTAASNNESFQRQLLEHHPEALAFLMQLLGGEAEDPAMQALSAMAAIVRNNAVARGTFYRAAGIPHLQLILRDPGRPLRLRRTALGLLTDLLHMDIDALAAATAKGTAAGVDVPAAVHTVLQLLAEGDRDLQEKCLLLLQVLLMGDASAVGLLREAGGAAQLSRLHSGLAAQATVVGAAGGGSTGDRNGDDEESDAAYLRELLGLVEAVQQQLAGGPQQLHAEL